MKTTTVLILSVLFSLCVNSCKKQKNCPAFNENDLVDFPYLFPDTLVFKTHDSSEFLIYISEINLSEAYSYNCKDLYKICPCINYIEAVVTDSKKNESYSFLKMEQSDVSTMQYFKYNLHGFEFEFDFRNELPYIDQMEHLKYFDNYTIGGKLYADVIEITNLELSNADIYKAYFNKANGLLRFIKRSDNSVWSLESN